MKHGSLFAKSLLVHSIGLALCSFSAWGETFNRSLLVGNSAEMDWNNAALVVTPGPYDLDVYINKVWRGKFNLQVTGDEKGTITINKEDIAQLNIQDLSFTEQDKTAQRVDIETLLHGGKSHLDPSELRLDLEIPQAYVITPGHNWVAPQRWDAGINGFYTNYTINYYNFHGMKSGYTSSDNIYLSLNSGLNLYGWHLIDNSTWMHYSTQNKNAWVNATRYLEKPLATFGAIMRLGRSYTTSDYFDTVRFRGLTLNKSRQMLPDSERVYMPVISGIAATTAIVSVYQDGHIIHQETVPPGPFAIRDLMPTGSRGDLTVEVGNTGGATERFVVPFASIPDMLRPGTSDYQLNLGQVDMRGVDDDSTFAQMSYSRGINNYVTASAGSIWSQGYQALLLGSSVSLPYVGSLSGSVEETRYRLSGTGRARGEKYALSWSKYFPTGTNISLASYYYRTQDYASFSDFVQLKSSVRDNRYGTSTINSKQAFSASINQTLPGGFGRLSLSAWWRDYWKGNTSSKQYNLSWSNAWHGVNYAVSLRRSEMLRSWYDYETNYEGNQVSALRSRTRTENNLYLSVTVPISLFGSGASLSSHASVQGGNYASSDVSLSGSAREMDYSLMLSHDRDASGRSADLYTSWKSPYSNLNAGLTVARDYRQTTLGASGNLLAWRGGVLASPNNGRNFVILEAPGLKNAAVNGDTSTRTNAKGIALVTSATPYRQNNYHLDEDTTQGGNVDLVGNMLNVAPVEGSITYLKYKTDTRTLYTLDVKHADGKPLPFGAMVYDAAQRELGYVAQGSQIFIKADSLPEIINVNISLARKKSVCQITRPAQGITNICR